MSKQQIIRGTLILTAATFLSKFLGLAYTFPFEAIIGDEGGGELFSYAYDPYTILLSISTMGVPLAVSKFVAKYNALGDYETGRRLYRSGLTLMAATGVVSFLALYSLAPFMAPKIITLESKHSVEDVVYVIRMVSTALIIVPVMSLIRGFFQGYESMGPTAVSQVIEQIVRIIFLLGGAYVILNVLEGTVTQAVGFAVFSAFIGALAGLAILIWYWMKRKSKLDQLLLKNTYQAKLSYKQMYKELLTYAGPFVFVGIANPLFKTIDMFTFNNAMASIGKGAISGELFGLYNFWLHKLILIPVAFATAMALTLIPTITASFTEQKNAIMKQQISQALQIIMFLVTPAAIGMAVVSYPAYGFLYGVEDIQLGGSVLRFYAPAALLFALFIVSTSVMQGVNQQRYAVISLLIGLFFKLILNVPLIKLFEVYGAISATMIGYLFAIGFNLWIIAKHTEVRYNILMRRSLFIIILTLLMVIFTALTQYILQLFIAPEDGRIQSGFVLAVSMLVGVIVYGGLSYRFNLAGSLLGQRFAFLKKTKKNID
ncbi:putative polysaccharide biosynthesis protein [Bacillus solimangrovi]|uniref:Cell division protein n=1 Tax=Bacillus solimangrovi TaxID=1305675 RepID=A0A1E5LDG2_9BACI|nr:polysaccharide biosynthesis protein [Bacillus solimangrovi]OEH92125.1 cell division protein [Bacillus solimangrovi]